MEYVDILEPPRFDPTGVTKPLKQAIVDEEWVGSFNLWVLQDSPVPAIVYQKRSSQSTWGPDLLDVTAGGFYAAGEKQLDGLREAEEELGKIFNPTDVQYIGRKINITKDTDNYTRKNLVDIYFTIDNSPLESYVLEKAEVFAVCISPIEKLLKVHTDPDYTFMLEGLDNEKNKIQIPVNKTSFPYNWDNYHYKIALLAKRYLNGEKDLLY